MSSIMQEKMIVVSECENISYSQEMESEPLVLELEEEEVSGSESVSGQTKKVLKWLPTKNKYMFYSIIAFLENLRSEHGVSDETVEFYYSKLPMFETPEIQKAFLESMVDIKHIEKDIYRPLVKEHKKTVRETLKQEQKANKKVQSKKAKETVTVTTVPDEVAATSDELSVSEKKTEKPTKEKVVKEKVVKEKVVKEKVVKEKAVKEKVVPNDDNTNKEPVKQRGRKQKTITVEYNNENTGSVESSSTEVVLDTVVDHLMEKMTTNLNNLVITTPAPVIVEAISNEKTVTAPTLPENPETSISVVTKKKTVKKSAVPK